MKKLSYIALSLLMLPAVLIGQVHPLAEQYLLNLFQLNPAIAGVVVYDPLVINARQQGLKWKKSPGSQSVSYQSKLFKEKDYFNKRGFLNRGENAFGKVGVGAGIFNYSYGSVSQTGFHLDYAYHVFVGNGRLSFGLAPVFLQFKANFADDSFTFDENPDDVWLPQGNDPISVSFIDFNAGVHFYSETFTAGFSFLQMFNSTIHLKGEYGFPSTEKPLLNPDLSRSLYGYGGYLFKISRSFQVEPMLMLKYNANTVSPFRFDLNATAYFLNDFQTGFSYRWNDGIAAFMGIRLNKLQIRYLFELPLAGKTPLGFTGHMIQVGIDLGQKIN
ncbi:MAG: PorP/SprF family type IX secretion system membrane protein [Bacteroidales bacterium]